MPVNFSSCIFYNLFERCLAAVNMVAAVLVEALGVILMAKASLDVFLLKYKIRVLDVTSLLVLPE